MNNSRLSSLISFANSSRLADPAQKKTTLRNRKSITVPFSAPGIAAVLSSPAIFMLDLFSGAHVSIGVLYVLLLVLLSNERRTLIVLFSTISSLMLVINLRLFYGQPGNEMMTMDKVIGLIALWVITSGILRYRHLQKKSEAKRARKPVCCIRSFTEIPERKAKPEELITVLRHLRTSGRPIDPCTRELTWFIYMKSPKN